MENRHSFIFSTLLILSLPAGCLAMQSVAELCEQQQAEIARQAAEIRALKEQLAKLNQPQYRDEELELHRLNALKETARQAYQTTQPRVTDWPMIDGNPFRGPW